MQQDCPSGSASADGDLPSLSKKLKLSLGRLRFNKPKSIEKISKGFVPANTAKSTAWGVKVFQDCTAEVSTDQHQALSRIMMSSKVTPYKEQLDS